MALTDRLRTAIHSVHSRIEDTAIARAIVGGDILLSNYSSLLFQYYNLHLTVETLAAENSILHELFLPQAFCRSETIRKDLHNLGVEHRYLAPPTSSLMESLRKFPEQSALHRLISVLYNLEGARMSSLLILKPLAKALGVKPEPDKGIDYHLDGFATRAQDWVSVKHRINRLSLSAEAQEDVISTSVSFANDLLSIYEFESRIHTAGLEACG